MNLARKRSRYYSIILAFCLCACALQQPTRLQQRRAAHARSNLVLAYLKIAEPLLAGQQLSIALNHAPYDFDVQLIAAVYHQLLSNLSLAEFYYHRIIKQQPNNLMLLLLYTYFLCLSQQESLHPIYYKKILAHLTESWLEYFNWLQAKCAYYTHFKNEIWLVPLQKKQLKTNNDRYYPIEMFRLLIEIINNFDKV